MLKKIIKAIRERNKRRNTWDFWQFFQWGGQDTVSYMDLLNNDLDGNGIDDIQQHEDADGNGVPDWIDWS